MRVDRQRDRELAVAEDLDRVLERAQDARCEQRLGRDLGAGLEALGERQTLTPCVYVRNGPKGIESLDCAPRSFGTCMCSGIWPPMNPARIMCEPERDFWPF